jgi:protein CpxP
MNRKITTIIAAVILLAGGSILTAHAQEDRPEKKEWKERLEARKQELFKELNLTDAQRQQLDANRKKNQESTKALRQSIRDNMELMGRELEKDALDMARINEIQAEIKSAHAKIMDNRLQGILEVRGILTPEQFKRFSEHMQKEKDKLRQKMSEFRDGPKGGSGGGGSEGGPGDELAP